MLTELEILMWNNDSRKITRELEARVTQTSTGWSVTAFCYGGKVVPVSANQKSNGDEISLSRIGFPFGLIRVLYVIINDFGHQMFSREISVREGKRALMILRPV